MALAFFEEGPASLDPRAALHVPIGAASPLWLLFAGAASSGVAWWWMTRWAARTHLEAAYGLASLAPTEVEIEVAADTPAPQPEGMVAAAALVSDPAAAIEQAAEHTAPLVEALEPPPQAPPAEPLALEPAKVKSKAKPADEPPPAL